MNMDGKPQTMRAMNTKYYMMAALFVLALSCSKEMDVMESVSQPKLSSELVPITFTVDAQSAKTALGASNSVVWSDGDQVSVFDDVIGNTGSYEVKEGRVAASVSETATSVFALYPSSTEASLSGSVITAEIPAVQNAVAGSFGPGANLSVARTTPADAHFVFRNVGGLLKFTLLEEGVTKVVVKANGGEKIAGAVSVTLNTDGTIASASCTGSSTVTLQPESGTLTKGATYYIVVAPGTLSDGVTVLLERENQKNPLCRKGSSQLDIPSSVIKSLGTVKEALYDDLYTAYQEMDATLYIAGEAYSKATKGSAELLVASGERDIKAKVQAGGVYFLETTKESDTFNHAPTVLTISNNVVLLSRFSQSPVTVKPTTYTKIHTGSFVVGNIVLDLSNNANYSFNNANTTSNFGSLVIDNCIIKNIKKQILYCGVLTKGIGRIAINNNTIQLNGSSLQLFNFAKTTVLQEYCDLSFENNVVFSETCVPAQIFNYGNGDENADAEWTGKLVVKNNIFYNCPGTNVYFKAYKLSSLVMKNNVLWGDPAYSTGGSVCFALYGSGQDASVVDVNDNIAYGLANGKNWDLAHSNSVVKLDPNRLTKLTSDPFESFNTATGAYTLKEAYKSYGPQK